MVMICTHNSLRPLKKGLVSHCTPSGPLPIGWHSLMHSENKDLKIGSSQPTKRSSRHLTSDRLINKYAQARFSLLQLLTA